MIGLIGFIREKLLEICNNFPMFHKFRSKRYFLKQLEKYPLEIENFKFPIESLILNSEFDRSILSGSSCALVGNSGHLLEQDYAQLIDSYDVVMRFNLAPVKGFENKVGTKTTLRVINNKTFSGIKDPMINSNRDNQLLDFIDDNILVAVWEDHHFQSSIFKFSHAKKLLFLNQEFQNNICNRYFYRSATTGFIGAIIALNLFKDISLFGFSFYQGDWNQRHYFESCKKFVSEHSHDQEKFILESFANKKYLTIY